MSESEPETADVGEPILEDLVADNPDEVARFIERLGVVNELLDTADLATAAMDDRMVEDLTETTTYLGAAADGLATPQAARLGEVADIATDDDVARALEGLLEAVGEAGAEPTKPLGIRGLARALWDLDVRRGLGFMIAVARKTGRRLRDLPER